MTTPIFRLRVPLVSALPHIPADAYDPPSSCFHPSFERGSRTVENQVEDGLPVAVGGFHVGVLVVVVRIAIVICPLDIAHAVGAGQDPGTVLFLVPVVPITTPSPGVCRGRRSHHRHCQADHNDQDSNPSEVPLYLHTHTVPPFVPNRLVEVKPLGLLKSRPFSRRPFNGSRFVYLVVSNEGSPLAIVPRRWVRSLRLIAGAGPRGRTESHETMTPRM